jgi:PBSX family phage terminase large subunit
MAKRFNPNLTHLRQSYREGKSGAILEGGSRSGKTWSGIDFIVFLCASHSGITINIIRETYNSFKTTIYDDLNRRFPTFGLQSPAISVKDLSTFWLFGNRVNFLGADNPAKFDGAGCDFAFFNEMLDIPKSIFDQQEQRCRRFWWGDYNPKHSDHWVFNNVLKRKDVSFLHTTIFDNPYVSASEKRKIISYDPTDPANVAAGTADDYLWKVYGLGERASPQGLIYTNVTWIDELPDEFDKETWGLDFGYTASPAVLCQTRIHGNNLYAKKRFYQPFENASSMAPVLAAILPKEAHVWCDSADPIFISDLRRLGFKALAVKKAPNYKMPAIGNIKRFKIHLVNDQDVKNEQTNYHYRVIQGIQLDEPIDDFDHFFDALLYSTIHEIRVGL